MTNTRPSTVLVGYDGSEQARRAVDWAAAEARSLDGRLVIATAVESPQVSERIDAWFTSEQLAEETAHERAESDLDTLAGEVLAANPALPVEPVLREGSASEVINAVADEVETSMTVVGGHGTGGISRMFAGSTAAEVVHTERRPVIIVRGDGQTGDAPVVLGVDGSKSCDAAVAFAFDFASRHRRTLCALHAWSDVTLSSPAEPIRALFDEELQAMAATFFGDLPERYPDVRVDWTVVTDRPAHALLERAGKAALLVIGSHGRGPVRRALLGSVSHAALHDADCPIAIVRA